MNVNNANAITTQNPLAKTASKEDKTPLFGAKVAENISTFSALLKETGLEDSAKTVDEANKFNSEMMKRASQEAFAVGTLLILLHFITLLTGFVGLLLFIYALIKRFYVLFLIYLLPLLLFRE